jgi:pyridoxine 4-dehydrogenase
MTTTLNSDASAASEFAIGGDLPVRRLGFGALRITGPSFWGEPSDRAAALRLLRRAREQGVTLFDTADSYGPHVSETLIREALHPYGDMVVATKGGYLRPSPEQWIPLGRPEYLIQSARLSARRLGVERIDLWQLHRIDPQVPRDEQFDAIRRLRDEGVIRYVGLSEVSIEDIEAAQAWFPVATVQNRYSHGWREHDAVLDYCQARGVGFMAFFPLGGGRGGEPQQALSGVAARHGVSTSQVALAWLLERSPVTLPIPGTSRIAHLEENVAAARLRLDEEDLAALAAARASDG